MGGSALEQAHYAFADDDPANLYDPSSCTFYTCDSPGKDGVEKLENFHLRVQVNDTSGKEVSLTAALFYNTTNDPSTAVQVTTDGSVNAVAIVPDSLDILNDGTTVDTRICASSATYWDNGDYRDTSDVFSPVALLSGHTELQMCLQFTSNASYKQTYYFWIKHSDGTALDVYTVVPSVTLSGLKSNAETKWNINAANRLSSETRWNVWQYQFDLEWQEKGSSVLHRAYGLLSTSYHLSGLSDGTEYRVRVRKVGPTQIGAWSEWTDFGTINHSTLDASWKILSVVTHEADLAWKTATRVSRDTRWTLWTYYPKTSWKIFDRNTFDTKWGNRIFLEAGWDIQTEISGGISWNVGRYDLEVAWHVLNVTFDIECELVSNSSLVHSNTGLKDFNYKIPGLFPNTQYRFRVRAVDSGGIDFGWSSWVTFTTQPAQIETAWEITNKLVQGTQWTLNGVESASLSIAWTVVTEDQKSIAYRILRDFQKDLAWRHLERNDKDVSWQIADQIPPPTNLQTTNITETSARFEWEGV